MCGISGIWNSYKESKTDLLIKSKSMSDSLLHRGPDDSGLWANEANSISLSHRRLSILDLSKTGTQPMISSNKRFILTFNGEIYNHKDLRKDINKEYNYSLKWRGSSDTETFLEHIQLFGIIKTLDRSNGMFSFGLWDDYEKELFLVRDRFGEKPLYWGYTHLNNYNGGKTLVFASELSAIFSIKGFQKSIDLKALESYFKFGYISGNRSIQKGIYHLGPGELLKIKAGKKGFLNEEIPNPIKWWDSFKKHNELKEIFSKNYMLEDEDYFTNYLERKLGDVIQEQSNSSDVPLGTFLSGGIDSTLVTTLLQKRSSKPIKSFTVRFDGFKDIKDNYDESGFAKKIAHYLGTEHTEVLVSPSEVLRVIDSIAKVYSEPFSDSSQVPTNIICENIKSQGISVALTGDGADELFGGYSRHLLLPKVNKYFGNMPFYLRKLLVYFLQYYPISKNGLEVDKFQKLRSSILSAGKIEDIYNSVKMIQNYTVNELCIFKENNSEKVEKYYRYKTIEESLMISDILTYLHSDILVKLDRASMFSSLETRAPFLDNRIAEIAWLIPLSLKIKQFKGKQSGKIILRRILSKYIPDKLLNRPKQGFTMPTGPWLKGPLKNWAKDLLSYETIKKQGFIDPKIVETILNNHLNGSEDNTSRLWNILMWQAWLNEWY